MDIKRYLLSIVWLWKEIDYSPERYEFDGYFAERWIYKHRVLKRVAIIQRFQGTSKEKLIAEILKIYDNGNNKRMVRV